MWDTLIYIILYRIGVDEWVHNAVFILNSSIVLVLLFKVVSKWVYYISSVLDREFDVKVISFDSWLGFNDVLYYILVDK